MDQSRFSMTVSRTAVACGLAAILHVADASAQRLSLRCYDVPDGLAHSRVSDIHQDAKGYLWLATWEGLSRFDGYRFTNYGGRDGLGPAVLNAITEDRHGRLWVGTNDTGVARLIDDPRAGAALPSSPSAPATRRKFVNYRVGATLESNRVNALLFDANDNLWCATDNGLYRAAARAHDDLKFEVVVPHEPVAQPMAAYADSRGRLWFGMVNDLIEVVGERTIKYGPADEVGRHTITSIVEDRQGRLLVANLFGVFEFIEPAAGQDRGRWRRLPVALKPDQEIYAMAADANGALWIGAKNGLIKFQGGQGVKQTVYTTAQGLSADLIRTLYEDRVGNLWIGTFGGGVCKLSGEMIVSFTKTEGLPDHDVIRVIESSSGRIYASTRVGGLAEIIEGKVVPLQQSLQPPFDTIYHRILQDGRGDWWIGTDRGLFRFQGPELQLRHGQKFTLADGISETTIGGGMYADPTGRVWIGSNDGNLYWGAPARKGRVSFEHISLKAMAPFAAAGLITGDRSGALWLGTQLQLGRFRNGSINLLQPTDGLPETLPRAFHLDSRGWLWIGLRLKGVSLTKDPGAEPLKFINYSTANGLASDTVWAIAEDDAGRIYLGTGKGLDRLDPATGRIRHFATADGLAGEEIHHCLKDRQGNIWVATARGLSKLNPRAERVVNRPPPIYLSRVNVAGEDQPLAETGVRSLTGVTLAAARNNLLIEYVGLDFQGERALKYQYQLEGVDEDWSPPTEQRTVNYARLTPGAYRFLARAINQQGQEVMVSPEPATIEFRILPPLWRRWWFLAGAGMLTGLAAYLIIRNRVARLLELERVRTRIAADLHDDIGSSLSQIAVFSEVVRRRVGRPNEGEDATVTDLLGQMAATSRELVDAMSDIVWAIDPRKDQLSDLVQRMRRFASDVFTARQIAFRFEEETGDQDVKLRTDVRRQVFLIFKESVNNVVRHSACRAAEIEFRLERGGLCLKVSDDGKGFDGMAESDGHGLVSMRERAKALGGQLTVSSSNNAGSAGTTVTLRVPLGRRFTLPARQSPPS